MTSINTRIGSPVPPPIPPASRGKAHAAEEAPAPKDSKADKPAVPSQPVRSGEANLRRFKLAHDKAANAASSSGAAASNAASGAVAGDEPRQLHLATRMYLGSLKVLVSALALSSAFRLARNPGDFAQHPMAALSGAMNFGERVNEHTLHAAQQAVLGRFGDFIPANAPCHHVQAAVSFDMEAHGIPPGIPGAFNREDNHLLLAPYHVRLGGTHAAVHEYCHCFAHPQLPLALEGHPDSLFIEESLTEHMADKIPTYGPLSSVMSRFDSDYDRTTLSNGKNMQQAAQELEAAVGEPMLLRAYFSGNKAAIRAISRAAVDIYPQKVSPGTWNAALEVGGKEGAACTKKLAECFIAASLLSEGKLPPNADASSMRRSQLPVSAFSRINDRQQAALLKQAEAARERLGPKFDQAFYNFDEGAAKQALRAVRDDMMANWKNVL